MNRSGDQKIIAHYLYWLDEAFSGVSGAWHSLLENLHSVDTDAWLCKPVGGSRSICDIAVHLGACKVMYADYAFGSASLTWTDACIEPWPHAQPPHDEVLSWLRDAHQQLREHIAALYDDDLMQPRRANWGELKETRWLIKTIIEHELYHAGEINHLRALLQANDRWRHAAATSDEQ